MDKVVLRSKKLTLTLVAEYDWQCHVYYSDKQNYKNVYLGTERVEFICTQLISGITKDSVDGDGVYKHGEIDIFWIMSLFGGHASLYGNVSDKVFKLFCVEDGGHFLPTITLNQWCIKKWVTQLSKFRLKYRPVT